MSMTPIPQVADAEDFVPLPISSSNGWGEEIMDIDMKFASLLKNKGVP